MTARRRTDERATHHRAVAEARGEPPHDGVEEEEGDTKQNLNQQQQRQRQRQPSSWTARESTQQSKGTDYLVELGKQSSNTNTAVGARKGLIDDVFAGTANSKFNLGADSDIASGELRFSEMRTFANLVGDFHVPPQFMDRVALHVAKNFLADRTEALGVNTRVPLILGVWGAKGCGKTFNLELACKVGQCRLTLA